MSVVTCQRFLCATELCLYSKLLFAIFENTSLHKTAMASINEGISSYFILSVVLELYRDSIVDKLVHNPFL